MGIYDGAEVCELVGTFILSKLENIIGKKNTGLYRDDGLVVLRNMNARGIDKIRKIIIKMFKDIGFQLEIKTNLKQVEFLDVIYKPNDNLLYINTSSDHPPQVIKQLTNTINKRLCENSKLQSKKRHLQMHCICNANIWTTCLFRNSWSKYC